MRNWNLHTSSYSLPSKSDLLLTYEELKPWKENEMTAVCSKFTTYLWGIETYSCNPLHLSCVHLLLTYEELKLSKFFINKIIVFYLLLTYEELKPLQMLRKLKRKPYIYYLPMRNWNNIANICSNKIWYYLLLTYEELKHWSNQWQTNQ